MTRSIRRSAVKTVIALAGGSLLLTPQLAFSAAPAAPKSPADCRAITDFTLRGQCWDALDQQGLQDQAVQTKPGQLSDDALLEQVDEQVSVTVPSSMESLTHLVSADNSSGAATGGSKHIVQTN